MSRQDISKWCMIICDADVNKLLTTYAGFSVMRLSDKKQWKNEVARFYEGDPATDYEDALAYAESIATVVLKSCNIEDVWKRLGAKPRSKTWH